MIKEQRKYCYGVYTLMFLLMCIAEFLPFFALEAPNERHGARKPVHAHGNPNTDNTHVEQDTKQNCRADAEHRHGADADIHGELGIARRTQTVWQVERRRMQHRCKDIMQHHEDIRVVIRLLGDCKTA